MPVPKRYFHVSQELNYDPELWVLTEKFGDRALRTWLQILAYLDRSENRWRVSEGSFETLGRTVRQYPKTVRRQVEEMVARGWLDVLETDPHGAPLVLRARNWMKYNRRAERTGTVAGAYRAQVDIPSVPTPTPTPTPLPTPKNKKEIAGLASPAPAGAGSRKVQLSDDAFIDALRENVAYKGINIDIELGKIDAWLLSPKGHGKRKTRNRILTWLNKAADEQRALSQESVEQPCACTEKVPSANGRTHTACGKPIDAAQESPPRPFCVDHLRGRQLIAAHLQNGHMS